MAMGWHVTGQRQQDNLTPQGVFEPVWIITFVVDPENVVGQVTVAERFYNAEYVEQTINAKVEAIKGVQAL